MKKHYCDIDDDKDGENDSSTHHLRFYDLSMGLNLHKDSFNYMRNQIMFGISQPKYDLGVFQHKRKSTTEMSYIEDKDLMIKDHDDVISMDQATRSS